MAWCCFASPDLVRSDLPVTYLVVPDPQTAFASIARQFDRPAVWEGISPQAAIHPSAVLASGVSVGPFAVIGEGCRVGAGSHIFSGAALGAFVEIGEGCQIHPQVTLHDRTQIGNRVKILAGSVIGSDGFGLLAKDNTGAHGEMPQLGNVVIEDDVRVGAKCTIDRGTLGETRVGRGTKIDDQVHIGHNCQIGSNCVLCAQVGIAGSTVLEDDVVVAGQVGIGHDVRIGKGAVIGAKSATSVNLDAGENYFGIPAIPLRESLRVVRAWRKLPDLLTRMKRVEKALNLSEEG